jgi:hypothetical protein
MRHAFVITTTTTTTTTMVALALLMVLTPGMAMAQWTPLSMRGFAEGYSHLPMSFPHDKVYVQKYKDGVAEHTFDLYDISRGGGCVILGTWPAHSSDNYRDFYRGWIAGDDTYAAQEGHSPSPRDLSVCSPGHSAEFCAGYHFGFNIPANGDAT